MPIYDLLKYRASRSKTFLCALYFYLKSNLDSLEQDKSIHCYFLICDIFDSDKRYVDRNDRILYLRYKYKRRITRTKSLYPEKRGYQSFDALFLFFLKSVSWVIDDNLFKGLKRYERIFLPSKNTSNIKFYADLSSGYGFKSMYIKSSIIFLESLIDVSNRLKKIPKHLRQKCLEMDLELLNCNLPCRIHLPFIESKFVLSIKVEYCAVLDSAENCPYMVLLETADEADTERIKVKGELQNASFLMQQLNTVTDLTLLSDINIIKENIIESIDKVLSTDMFDSDHFQGNYHPNISQNQDNFEDSKKLSAESLHSNSSFEGCFLSNRNALVNINDETTDVVETTSTFIESEKCSEIDTLCHRFKKIIEIHNTQKSSELDTYSVTEVIPNEGVQKQGDEAAEEPKDSESVLSHDNLVDSDVLIEDLDAPNNKKELYNYNVGEKGGYGGDEIMLLDKNLAEPIKNGTKTPLVVNRNTSMFRVSPPSVTAEISCHSDESELSSEGYYGYKKDGWQDQVKSIKKKSRYSKLRGWSLKSMIIKTGSSLKQEIIATQILNEMKNIWKDENKDIWIYIYQIYLVNNEAGLVETVTNALSIHKIKESGLCDNKKFFLKNYFIDRFGYKTSSYKKAVRNFLESLVGYSLACYILQIKDRHNGNILLDEDGHLIHVDFGFILGDHPGFYCVEIAPFKFSNEYLDLLEDLMEEFKMLFLEGFLALRKHSERLCRIVEILSDNSNIKCLNKKVLMDFRDRLKLEMSDKEIEIYVFWLINKSLNSMGTGLYDSYQYFSNGYL